MLLSHLQEMLIDDREANGFSPRTIDRYVYNINQFIEFAGDLEINDLDQSHIDEYKLYLLNKIRHDNNPYGVPGGKLSRSTINSYLKEVYTMINFARKKKIIVDDNLELEKVKEEIKTIDIMSEDEILKLVQLPEETYVDLRNKLCIYLMLDSGLRVQEVEHANIDSFDLDYQCFIIENSKGMKSRKVPISSSTIRIYNLYMSKRPRVLNDALLLTRDNDRITYDAIKMMLQRKKEKLRIKKFNPHHLRHTFATRYLIEQILKTGKADVFTLMQILGHNDVKTTMRYLHTANMYLLKGHEFSPMDTILERNKDKLQGKVTSKNNVIPFQKINKTQ